MYRKLAKRVIGIFFCLVLALLDSPVLINASSAIVPINITLDGISVSSDVSPYLDSSNRTMVPVRFVSEALGAKVDWAAATRTVTVTKNSKKLTLRVGSVDLVDNGSVTKMDTVAVIKDSRTFVPVRFIAEALGLYVGWNASSHTVLLSTSANAANVTIKQVDNSHFPDVTLYVDVDDVNGNNIQSLSKSNFQTFELNSNGTFDEIDIQQVRQVTNSGDIRLNLVMDRSASMDGSKIRDAKTAAKTFVNEVEESSNGSLIELISFGSDVTLLQPFTSDFNMLRQVINNISLDGTTALYDAIGYGILRSNDVNGIKCVIAFTDGEENSSRNYSNTDIAEMSVRTGIPVYIIGIGVNSNAVATNLARLTGGAYYSISTSNLNNVLAKTYSDIYNNQKGLYAVTYRSKKPKNDSRVTVRVDTGKGYAGSSQREYTPVTNLNVFTGGIGWSGDYIIPESSNRFVTTADFYGKTIAQLRVARNEIYARHGRMFTDPYLNKWFFSKTWYMQISQKLEPSVYDARPDPFNQYEKKNVLTILDYENALMASQNIFFDYSSRAYSEYDVYLRKDVLQRGLSQIYSSKGVSVGDKSRFSNTERANVELIENAIRNH